MLQPLLDSQMMIICLRPPVFLSVMTKPSAGGLQVPNVCTAVGSNITCSYSKDDRRGEGEWR